MDKTRDGLLVFLTCENRHSWARVGERTGDHSISVGPCSGEGGTDDPTICERCGQPATRISVCGAPTRRTTRKATSN